MVKKPKVSVKPSKIIDETNIKNNSTQLVISYKYLCTNNSKYSMEAVKDSKIKIQYYNDFYKKILEYSQIEVKVPQLYCRVNPNLNGEILGFAKQGIYNYIDKTNADGYDWYSINVGWIAYSPDWCNLYPKKVIEEPPKEEPKQDIPKKPTETVNTEPKGENNTNTLPDTKNNENEKKNKEKRHGLIESIVSLFKIVIETLKKFLKRKK